HFRIYAHHLRSIQCLNKCQHVAGGWQIYVTTRFIGLSFQGKNDVVFLIQNVGAQVIDRFAVPLQGIEWILAGVHFDTLSTAPENEDGCTKLDSEIDSFYRFLHGKSTHTRVI